jgi:hypothetical protein
LVLASLFSVLFLYLTGFFLELSVKTYRLDTPLYLGDKGIAKQRRATRDESSVSPF